MRISEGEREGSISGKGKLLNRKKKKKYENEIRWREKRYYSIIIHMPSSSSIESIYFNTEGCLRVFIL